MFADLRAYSNRINRHTQNGVALQVRANERNAAPSRPENTLGDVYDLNYRTIYSLPAPWALACVDQCETSLSVEPLELTYREPAAGSRLGAAI